jgi:hypothetical protein
MLHQGEELIVWISHEGGVLKGIFRNTIRSTFLCSRISRSLDELIQSCRKPWKLLLVCDTNEEPVHSGRDISVRVLILGA